ncbi:MAG: hypothetical protein HWE27_19245 [Gammaproteobacteria bacterium]|nr:hypothetical protein [Gammaproteobacteria bacterium]
MLHGFSGGMGTGKSLNAIKFIIEEDKFAGRPVYYHGIRVLLLDYSVCDSFQGWLYGIYWPANSHNKALQKKLEEIETENRLATIEDFPYLAYHYKKHDPFKQWLHWFKKCASPKRKALFQEALDVLELDEDSITYQDIEHLDLSWKQFDDPTQIHTIPAGAVVLVDEVQNIWPPRPSSKAMSDDVKFVTTHRHRGNDLVYISQDFLDTDQIIRRRMQQYVHFEFAGGENLYRYSHNKGFDPKSKADLATAQRDLVKRDKKYYGVYLSSVKHTQKPKMDPKLKKGLTMLGAAALGIAACAYYMVGFVFSSLSPEVEAQEVQTESTSSQPATATPIQYSSDDEYLTRFIPRSDALPFSSPIYDDFTRESQTYPELTCVIVNNDCSCYTQQATAYAIDLQHCVNIAVYGYFDPFQSTDKTERRTSKTQSSKNELNSGGIF